MVGTIEPRKAYDRAIAAFELMWESRPNAPSLVIVGSAGWKTAALQDRIRRHSEYGRRLHWLQQASDEALHQAYAAARAVLIASYAEGWPAAAERQSPGWAWCALAGVSREATSKRIFTADRRRAVDPDRNSSLGEERGPKHVTC